MEKALKDKQNVCKALDAIHRKSYIESQLSIDKKGKKCENQTELKSIAKSISMSFDSVPIIMKIGVNMCLGLGNRISSSLRYCARVVQ